MDQTPAQRANKAMLVLHTIGDEFCIACTGVPVRNGGDPYPQPHPCGGLLHCDVNDACDDYFVACDRCGEFRMLDVQKVLGHD
jgi:hypothetical protein